MQGLEAAGAGCSPRPAAGAGPAAYWRCLKTNPAFRLLWAAKVLNSGLGWWLTYVGMLQLVVALSGGQSGLAVSAALLTKLLPAVLVSPAAGAVADRWGGAA